MAGQRMLVSRSVTRPFACRSCGWKGEAHGHGVGEGTAIGLGSHDPAARQRAEAHGARAAERDAAEVVSIAPCPGCYRRDRAAVTAYHVRTGLKNLGMFAAAFAVAGLVGLVTSWRYGAGVGLVAALGGVYIEHLKRQGTWYRSADVDFTER